MAELRRLLIDPGRFDGMHVHEQRLLLRPEERHYIKRVLRKRDGDLVALIDGRGHLWHAKLEQGDALRLSDGVDHPQEETGLPVPKLGLAVALVRRGTDDWIRMATELGVDVFQPLLANRCTAQAELRPKRWQSVIREATEQCERLWMPQLETPCDLDQWNPGLHVRVGFAVTRAVTNQNLDVWLHKATAPVATWLVVGPEGGWTDAEIEGALNRGWEPVSMGPTILRTSTAAVRAAVSLVGWRSLSF